MLLLGAACGTEEESPPPEPTSAPEPSQEPEPEPTTALPQGTGEGDVALEIAGDPVPGDDWSATCAERDGGFAFNAVATPLSTVQLDVGADGSVTNFVASGEGFGPFTADESAAADLGVEVTETGFTFTGSIEAGTVSGSVTCPA